MGSACGVVVDAAGAGARTATTCGSGCTGRCTCCRCAIVSLAFGTCRRRSLPIALLGVVSPATPAAFWPRFTLALPGALLVALAAGSEDWSRRWRSLVDVSIGALALAGMVMAAPGFTPEGPPIWALGDATLLQRAESATAIGQARAWLAAREAIGVGESASRTTRASRCLGCCGGRTVAAGWPTCRRRWSTGRD